MKSKLRVVIDTNILLVSISDRSKYHWIYQGLLNADFEASISNDTLTEYEEIISSKFIVTHDKHFNVLRTVEFPKVNVVDIVQFQNLLAGCP